MTFVDEQIPLLDEFRALDSDTITFRGRTLTREQLIASKATRLFVRSSTKVDAALLDGTQIEFVGSATAGIDHIDLDFLNSRRIEFSYAPGSNADAVASYVEDVLKFQVPSSTFQVLSSRSQSLLLKSLPAESPLVAVFGHGHVGSRVARIAEAMGMKVLISDPPLGMNTSLEGMLHTADIITLHVPLTTSGPHATYRMIDEQQIAMMKQGAVLINTSRGDVVNERAVVRAHIIGKITAVLDVFENEPSISRETVEALTMVTPHIAGYTHEAKLAGAAMILEATPQGATPQGATPQGATSREATGSDRRRVEVIARRFREAWLADPTPATFDRMRQESLDL